MQRKHFPDGYSQTVVLPLTLQNTYLIPGQGGFPEIPCATGAQLCKVQFEAQEWRMTMALRRGSWS